MKTQAGNPLRALARVFAMDRASPRAKAVLPPSLPRQTLFLALDRDSVRNIDADGHLRVAEANISKATVSPYPSTIPSAR
jgi:hypothetical protein